PILSAPWVAGDGGAPGALGLGAVHAAAMSTPSDAAITRLGTLMSAAPSLPEVEERRPTAGAPSSRERLFRVGHEVVGVGRLEIDVRILLHAFVELLENVEHRLGGARGHL